MWLCCGLKVSLTRKSFFSSGNSFGILSLNSSLASAAIPAQGSRLALGFALTTFGLQRELVFRFCFVFFFKASVNIISVFVKSCESFHDFLYIIQ